MAKGKTLPEDMEAAFDMTDSGSLGTRNEPDVRGYPEMTAEERAAEDAVDKLLQQAPDHDQFLVQQLAQEAEAEDEDTKKRVSGGPIWTLARMQKREPLEGDLYKDGTFIYHFRPLTDTDYCQSRFKLSEAWEREERGAFVKLQHGYVEVLVFLLIDLPLRETVQDEMGNDIEELDPDSKSGGMRIKTVPFPITIENISRLPYEVIVELIDDIIRNVRGEVKGKPS